MIERRGVNNNMTVEELGFEERAENLSKTDLHKLTILSDAEKTIVKKLIGPGAKLLSGPRGSGKSTLLRTAFFEAKHTKTAFAVYVNYAKALATEPLFHTHADAAVLFRQWVLAKVIIALREAADLWSLNFDNDELRLIEKAEQYVESLQTGAITTDSPELTPSFLTKFLVNCASRVGVARTVLLLDDAAHAFSVKQQREFFEIFRELRSREVSGKAAIYPGVTSFSPTFQVGHEAELIEAWFKPNQENYLQVMHQIVKARFPEFKPRDPAVIDALALASFGLPRGFLGMCYELQESGYSNGTRSAIVNQVNVHADLVRTVFSNIADRLPRFEHFIKSGKKFERITLAVLRDYNAGKDIRHKSGTLALSEPISVGLRRVLSFMEYAGLVRSTEGVLSKGIKGSYKRYLINYSLIIGSNSLSLGKSYKLNDIVTALEKPNAHSLVKTKAETLLGEKFETECVLALPPCPQCGAVRHTEEQKFCMSCGKELHTASVYHDLLKASVNRLPLPPRKIDALKSQGFLTVGQLLSDENQSFRRPGSSIGPVWAKRILTAAEEWVSV